MGLVTAALIEEEQRILIAQRGRSQRFGRQWEFPGGKLEAGETLAQALVREIKEELDIAVTPADSQVPAGEPFTIVKHAYTHFRITLHALHAVFQAGQQIKHIGVKDHAWVTLDDLKHYPFAVTDQKIIQALTVDE